MNSEVKLYDPMKARQNAALGSRQIGVLRGSDLDDGRRQSGSHLDIVNTDILRLDELGHSFDVLDVTKNHFRRRHPLDLRKYDLLINTATNADCDAKVLAVMEKILTTYQGRVLNPPERVLRTTRDQVSQTLSGIPNLVAPPTIRIRNSSPSALSTLISQRRITFPAILRRAGTHVGSHLAVVQNEGEVRAFIKKCRTDFILSHLYLTSFHSYRNSDGLYRKFRVFFIGGEPILRSMLISDRWNVHSSERTRFMVGRKELADQERYVLGRGFEGLPEYAKSALDEVRRRIGLDFFGIDFALLEDFRVLMFEANATMNFFNRGPIIEPTAGTEFAYTGLCFASARRAFASMLAS